MCLPSIYQQLEGLKPAEALLLLTKSLQLGIRAHERGIGKGSGIEDLGAHGEPSSGKSTVGRYVSFSSKMPAFKYSASLTVAGRLKDGLQPSWPPGVLSVFSPSTFECAKDYRSLVTNRIWQK